MNIEALRKVLPALPAKDQSFAQSLLDQFDMRGSLSEKQAYWVDKLAAGPAPKREDVKIDVSGVAKLFATAKYKGLKRAAIVIDNMRLSVAGQNARVPGSINVTDGGDFEGRTWFGRIVGDVFQPSRDCTSAVIENLKAFAANPVAHAAAHGHATGACCFCNRELTDERSIAVGYGPICADHYGLPWGA